MVVSFELSAEILIKCVSVLNDAFEEVRTHGYVPGTLHLLRVGTRSHAAPLMLLYQVVTIYQYSQASVQQLYFS